MQLVDRKKVEEHKKRRARKIEPDELIAKIYDYIDFAKENDYVQDISNFCSFADIDRQTYYNYSRQADYFDAVEMLKNCIQDDVIQKAFKANSSKFHEFMLKNRNKEEFSEKVVNENVNTNVATVDLTQLSKQELADLIKKEQTDE